MKIKLHPTYCLHELGKRKNNEDCIFPSKLDNNRSKPSNLFLVCDGVGGLAKGEEASKLVCEVLPNVLTTKSVILNQDIDEAVVSAETAMGKHIQQYPASDGMATTLTLLAFHEEGATIAHIGDSRVYQIRNGRVIFKTSDHSFVNELIEKKIISEQEARVHPNRNVVTRAMTGPAEPVKASIKIIKDIQAEDYFFLCTDGITETIEDHNLTRILSNRHQSDQEKIDEIKSLCLEHSKDNFSAYLVHVDQVEQIGTVLPIGEKTDTQLPKNLFWIIGGLAIAALGFFFFNNTEKKPNHPALKSDDVNIDIDLTEVPDSLATTPSTVLTNEQLNFSDKQNDVKEEDLDKASKLINTAKKGKNNTKTTKVKKKPTKKPLTKEKKIKNQKEDNSTKLKKENNDTIKEQIESISSNSELAKDETKGKILVPISDEKDTLIIQDTLNQNKQ